MLDLLAPAWGFHASHKDQSWLSPYTHVLDSSGFSVSLILSLGFRLNSLSLCRCRWVSVSTTAFPLVQLFSPLPTPSWRLFSFSALTSPIFLFLFYSVLPVPSPPGHSSPYATSCLPAHTCSFSPEPCRMTPLLTPERIQSLPGLWGPLLRGSGGGSFKPDEGVLSRVQGWGPRAPVPRGPVSFVLLNPLLGVGRARRGKHIPPLEPCSESTVWGGQTGGAGWEPAWASQQVLDTQGTVFRKLKHEKSPVHAGPSQLP